MYLKRIKKEKKVRTSDDKVVIFDWGGIVESHESDLYDLKQARIRLIRRFNHSISDEHILDRWTDKTSSGVLIGSTNNEEDIIDWVNVVQKNMNINITLEAFKKAYEEEFSKVKYYKDVVNFAHSLKNKCQIAILSNLTPFDKKRINDQYNLNKFDHVYLSFEIGMRKPDKKIFKYVQKDLKIDGKNILLIDDEPENILNASECGWNTCQAYGFELEKIKNAVYEFLSE